MRIVDQYWLPPANDLSDRLRALGRSSTVRVDELLPLSRSRLDFVQTQRLDRLLGKALSNGDGAANLKRMRLALLGSSTVDHLEAGLRVAALRRGIELEILCGEYGQYQQELLDDSSNLRAFAPNIVLLALDARHLVQGADVTMSAADADALVAGRLDQLASLWRAARRRFSAQVIQQTALPCLPSLIGSNEARLPGSPAAVLSAFNQRLSQRARDEGADLLAIDGSAAQDGLSAWHDPVLWHRAKQEISPSAAPAYGDMALRLVAAQQGVSSKCLVLDLDNTLWGGVIGDDGLEGISLGQGSALGEAFVAFQAYVRDLSRRGVILAVVSKNDLANAQSPFESHPEMLLKQTDIACFIANWEDKATNIRHVAEALNIGLDSLVFIDDNPFERGIVRRELPMVAVPEVSDDPALYAQTIADAGYFEALHVTDNDLARTAQYRGNVQREALRHAHTDLEGYLKSLDMTLQWCRFDRVGMQRIVQLINKTNQFNLRTQRYTEAQVAQLLDDDAGITLQLRLLDKFGDNGIISIIIGRPAGEAMFLDTWLMSCRVLGRRVEEASINLVAAEARRRGARKLIGEYLPTKKNDMVREFYAKLGFDQTEISTDGSTRWELDLDRFTPFADFMSIQESNP
jgi:FkbH-like protein